MRSLRRSRYLFGDFVLDADERTVSELGSVVALRPKVFETLRLLLENPGHVLRKEEMLAKLWEDQFVEENNLSQNISEIRHVLHETRNNKFIETVPKYGYRFVASVSHSDSPRPPRQVSPAIKAPQTRYLQNGDVNIAYQVLGDGPVDLLFMVGWVSHLEYFWKQPAFASFLRKLSSFSRLILFDQRGTGLSDRVAIEDLPTIEDRMDDVRAVLNAVGSEKAVLCGLSGAGPVLSLFANHHPERAAGLILLGACARNIKDSNYPWAPSCKEWEIFFDKMRNQWGGPFGIEQVAPSMITDPEFRQWYAEYLRMGASPGAAIAISRMNAEIDVRGVLPNLRLPALVIHRKDDNCIRGAEGRYVASLIPECKFVELLGKDHLPFLGEQDEVIDEIQNFTNQIGFKVDCSPRLDLPFGLSDVLTNGYTTPSFAG